MGSAGPWGLDAKDFTFLSETDPALNFEPAPAAAPRTDRIHSRSCGDVGDVGAGSARSMFRESSHFRSFELP